MKRTIILILSALLLSASYASAQDRILVTGTVTSSIEGVPMNDTRIYAFASVNVGLHEKDRVMAAYADGSYQPEYPCVDTYPMADGYYEISVPANGYLIFYKFPYEPKCVKVNRKTTIDVEIETTEELEESSVTVEGKKKTRQGKPVMHGNVFEQPVYYYFKDEMMGEVKGLGKTNARLIAQAYIVNADGSDTLHYYTPRVYDGEQFHATQIHWRNDYLYDLAENMPRFTEDKDSISFHVAYEFEPDDRSINFFKANIWVEDYNQVYYRDSIEIGNTGRVSRPFQFLEYSFDVNQLDRQKYFKEPRRENVSDAKDMKLLFKIGKAELDENDERTMKDLSDLRTEIQNLCNDEAATLTELHFEGYASPDGQYAKNLDLSDRRTKVVQREIESIRSSEITRANRSAKGFVAPWSDIVVSLERDSLMTEAAALREIVEQYPDDLDRQQAMIKRLPNKFYDTHVVPRLPELRSVKCKFAAIVKRILRPDEILDKYQKDSLYRTGKKLMTLNEFWHLLNLVEDEKELEDLCWRALAASRKSEGKYWPLPANDLAIMYLKRKQVDTTILAPFIDERYRANQPFTDKFGNKDYDKNPDAIVANQVQMFMLAKDYKRAEELSSIIENEHPMLRAIVRCLGGYITLDDPNEAKSIDLVKQSSPRNEVVIKLARLSADSELKDTTITGSLNKLNPKDPITLYLRAQYACLKYPSDPVAMKGAAFDRSKDPNFSHPKDEIIPAATPEDIAMQKDAIAIIKEDIELDKMYDDGSPEAKQRLADSEKRLADAEALLATMERGEIGLKPYDGFISEYDAAKIYLEQCFELDQKYVAIAKSDFDITEDLLKEILEKKK